MINQQVYLNMVSPVEVDGSVTLLLLVVGGELVTGAERNKPIRDKMVKLFVTGEEPQPIG